MKKKIIIIFLVLMFLLTSCSRDRDNTIQPVVGDITFQIVSRGLPVADAVVTLQSIGTKESDQYGNVVFKDVPKGTYQVTVSKKDFEKIDHSYYLNGENQAIKITMSMESIEPPAMINVIIGDNRLTLEWEPVLNEYLASYKIYKSLNGTDYHMIAERGSSILNYVDDEVANGNIYYYKIQAVDKFGEPSRFSEVECGIPNSALMYNILYSRLNFASGTYDIYLLQNSKESSIINSLASELCSDYHPMLNRILYVSDESGAEQVYTMDLSGENRKKLTSVSGGVVRPRFSPDGTEIVYENAQQILRMSVEGTNTIILAGGKDADWSPNGDKILYVAQDSQGVDNLFIMEQDGTYQEQLTYYSTPVKSPSWSPDGKKIVYIRDGQICIIESDGSNEIYLTKLTIGDEVLLDYPCWSPNGKEILYVSNDNEEEVLAIYVTCIEDYNISGDRRIIGHGIIPIVF